MKLREFVCVKCGATVNSGSAFHKLCPVCNKARLDAGKKKPKKVKRYKKKATGEREMFLEIWDEREHICVHCGKNLGDEPKAHYFSHIKPKGLHPKLRLVKNNIELLCMECHRQYDFGGL